MTDPNPTPVGEFDIDCEMPPWLVGDDE